MCVSAVMSFTRIQLDDANAVNEMEMRVRTMWNIRDDGCEL